MNIHSGKDKDVYNSTIGSSPHWKMLMLANIRIDTIIWHSQHDSYTTKRMSKMQLRSKTMMAFMTNVEKRNQMQSNRHLVSSRQCSKKKKRNRIQEAEN